MMRRRCASTRTWGHWGSRDPARRVACPRGEAYDDSSCIACDSQQMNQLTIRGFGDDLQHEIEALARERGISLNRAAVLLIRRGAGLDDDRPHAKVIGDSLDDFIGSWTAEDEAEFLGGIEAMEQIDDKLWR